MQRRNPLSLISLALAISVAVGETDTTWAAENPAPAPVRPGEVIALTQTPHLWIADERGIAHLAGDARVLAERVIDWTARRDVTVSELRAMPRGEPILTAPLVRIGEAIYLPRADAAGALATLSHIKSPEDLALLGVNAENYGRLVLDAPTWEQRYGVALDSLRFEDFRLDSAPLVGPSLPEPPTRSDDDPD